MNKLNVGDRVQFVGVDGVYRNLSGKVGTVRYRILKTLALVDFSPKQNVDGGAFVDVADLREATAPPSEECGKPAASLIPRWGMYFSCVLPKGHEGECEQGGNCFKHGEYVGAKCPSWPSCAEPPAPATPEAPPAKPPCANAIARCVLPEGHTGSCSARSADFPVGAPCDCNRCRIKRGAHPFLNGNNDVCTAVGAPPAGKTVAVSAKLYELITDFLRESEDIGSVGLLLLLDKERKGEEEK